MANVSLNLSNFKASGVYTLEYDQSENIVLNSQIIRLIVGFSRKGPFNAPVYIPDKKTAERVFGPIDEFLERRGSFFHRSLYASLEYGPVFALNLMKLNDDPDFGDKVPYQSFSLATTEKNGKKEYRILSSYYNKERFWYPDTSYLIGNANIPGSANAGKLFHITNLGQSPVSILIRKANVLGFDVTAREWYGIGKVPTYINEWDFLSDYFIEVKVVEGNWTNYDQLILDPTYSKYFTKRGLKKSNMFEFLGHDSVNTLAEFTGCIIPDFVDGNGINYSIDTIINQSLASIGIFVAIDKEVLENYDPYADVDDNDQYSAVDMVGHNFANPDRVKPDYIDFLSYKTVINDSLSFDIKNVFDEFTYSINDVADKILTSSVHYGSNYGYFDNVIKIPFPSTIDMSSESYVDDPDYINYMTLKNFLIPKHSLIKLASTWNGINEEYVKKFDANYATVESVYETSDDGKTYLNILWAHPFKSNELDITGLPITSVDSTAKKIIISKPSDPILLAKYNNIISKILFLKGFDILVEDQNTKVFYYYKIESIINDASTLTITLDTDSGLSAINSSITSYKVYIAADYYSVTDVLTTGLTLNGTNIVIAPTAIGKSVYNYLLSNVGNVSQKNVKVVIGYSADVPYEIKTINTITNGTGDNAGQLTITLDATYTATNADKIYLYLEDPTSTVVDVNLGILPKFILNPDKAIFFDAGLESASNPNLFLVNKGHKLYEYYETGIIQNGASIYFEDSGIIYEKYISFTKVKNDDGIIILKIQAFDNNNLTYAADSNNSGWKLNDTLMVTDANVGNNQTANASNKFNIFIEADDLSQNVPIIPNSWNVSKTSFQTRITDANLYGVEVGNYIVSETIDNSGNYNYMLTKIIEKKKIYSIIISSYAYEYKVNQAIKITNNTVQHFKQLEDVIDAYQLFNLDGFKITNYHLPGGKNKKEQLWKILGMLDTQNSNLLEMLKDKNIITFRYIVDTFDGGLEPMTGPKSWLTRLAKERQKCLAIMNAPSIKEFKTSNDPRFTELPTRESPVPILNTAYIADGANLTLGPSYTFSLPDEFWGSKFSGYFTPFITIRDKGKNIDVPPAAWVANLFVQKHQSSSPWAIVAGPKRGVLSDPKLVGLEYDYLQKDREFLEPVGLNPIIRKKGVGYMIFANAMAYQKTLSAFNNLHIRDLLITIEDSIEDILSNFLFEFNDATTRLQITTIVRSYLDVIRTQGGIYDYIVIMDDTNNTPATIDQNTAIIDIAIEPVRGIQKFINRITVLKTGGVSSGGFTVA
jgi:hypothetical protein